MNPALRPLAALLAALPLSAQTVWVVDVAGGGQFTQIQPAIAAARAGDVIVIRSGSYASFALTKALTIVGQGNVAVRSTGASSCAVSAIGSGQEARLANLQLGATPGAAGMVRVFSSPGTIYFESCSMDGGTVQGLDVASANVVLDTCTIRGGNGAPGLNASAAVLAANDTTFTGGDCCVGCPTPVPAAAGVVLDFSWLHGARIGVVAGVECDARVTAAPAGILARNLSSLSLASSTVTGGRHTGGNAGGPGLDNRSGLPALLSRCTVAGGAGTPPGAAINGPANQAPHSLEADASGAGLTRGVPVNLTWMTTPGDPTVVLLSADIQKNHLTQAQEPLWVLGTANWAVVWAGLADAQGKVALTVPVPSDPLLQHRAFWFHGIAGFTFPVAASTPVGGIVR